MLYISDFKKMKEAQKKITMLTAYDYISGHIAEQSNVDIILVGDSLGMVIQGNKTTIDVTLQDMIYHAKAVRKGAMETFILVDMPYMSYHLTLKETKANAARIMIETGANAVKIEGASQSRLDTIKALLDCEIPVCAHLGLTPQSINKFGQYSVQGKSDKAQDCIIKEAKHLEDSGTFMLVLECVPEKLGKAISKEVGIPVIGIGAGRYTDGQVLVWHDLLGLSKMTPKFVKQYSDTKVFIEEGIKRFVSEVKEGHFPSMEQIYYPINEE
ncbi:MAG: 3-methyl-2-oxobutanoate hydroxymethyltransferase [Candidatus Cloacimonetes bacterium]|nr:3-methyl-2-oxobutanoate hydroxymethyltransferase [Candidatus Cloacimonadota bacterium]